MPVEFVNAISTRPAAIPGRGAFNQPIDVAHTRRYAQTIEDWGFDYTLVPYGSDSADQYVLSTVVLGATERLKTAVAVRPNTAFPTVAAQGLATLDQIGQGRSIVHIISGGSDDEQARQGDYLSKPERYRRSAEFVQVLRDAWTRTEPFSHHGEFYRFDGFGPGYATTSGGPLPVSLGGSSDHAFAAGGQQADIFALWGEPLAETAQQIARVREEARTAGRTGRIRFWVTFRPVIAPTDELAWAKAEELVGRLERLYASLGGLARLHATNAGTTRLRDIAARQERHDGVLWTPRSFAGSGGASTLIVGSPETVAAGLVKYVELGADIISLPTLGDLGDAVETGRYVLPLVREATAGLDLDARFALAAAG